MSLDNNKNNTSHNNYRFNIAKPCCICSKSFITDIFDEKDLCTSCEEIYHVTESYDEDEYVRDYLHGIVNSDGRTRVVRYD